MKVQNLDVQLPAVSGNPRSKSLEVANVGSLYEKDASGKNTENLIGFYVNCFARRGDTLKVKFPLEVESKIRQLNQLIDKDKVVSITFTALRLKPYAFKGANGSVVSGVAAKADDFEIEIPLGQDDFEID